MKRTLSFLLVVYLTVLTACNQESTGTNTESSSAIIVVVENKEYNGTEDKLDQKQEIGDQIGTIEKKTKATKMPAGNNQSNYFTVGSEIYSVKGTEDYIIVKDKDHKSQLMKKVVQKRWVLSNIVKQDFKSLNEYKYYLDTFRFSTRSICLTLQSTARKT